MNHMVTSAMQNYKKSGLSATTPMCVIEKYNVGLVVFSFMIIKHYDCEIKLLILMSDYMMIDADEETCKVKEQMAISYLPIISCI